MNPVRRLGRGASRLVGGFRRLAGFSQFLVVLAVVAVVAAGVLAFRIVSAPDPSNVDSIDSVRVGPSDGTSIPAYVAASARSLAGLRGTAPVVALVSFREYRTASSATALLSGSGAKLAFARVPLAGLQTRLASFAVVNPATDLAAGLAALASARSAEAARSPDSAGAAVARKEAAAYRSGCACLYGAAIVAPPTALRAFALRVGVRAVEPAPSVVNVYQAVFLPLLPEQVSVVTPPPDSAAP
jgi:hypothetical protein